MPEEEASEPRPPVPSPSPPPDDAAPGPGDRKARVLRDRVSRELRRRREAVRSVPRPSPARDDASGAAARPDPPSGWLFRLGRQVRKGAHTARERAAAQRALRGGTEPSETEPSETEPDQQSPEQAHTPQTDRPETGGPEADRPTDDRPEPGSTEADRPRTDGPETDRPKTGHPKGDGPETGGSETGGAGADRAEAGGAGAGAAGVEGPEADDGVRKGPSEAPLALSRAALEGLPDPAHDVEQRKREAGVDHRFPFGRPGEPLGRAHPFVFGFTGALGVITAWLLIQAATKSWSVIVMIMVAMFLAVGLNPAVERLRRFGLPRGVSVALVFFGLLLFFSGFVASLIPPLTEQITALIENTPKYVQDLQNNKQIAEWDQRYNLLDRLQEKVSDPDFQDNLAERAIDIGKQAVSGTVQTFTIMILTLYFLGSLPQIKTFFYKLAPRSRRARVALLGDEILDRIGGYVAGQFLIALIAGVTSYIFLAIVGLPYALALSLIVAFTALIPLVGATIGAVVVALVGFLYGIPEGIACVVFYLIYQQVENYVIYPRIMKRSVDVQPAVTIVAALIGATLLGVVGALLAIPTAAAVSLLIREVFFPRQDSI